jgi:DNA polymerase
MDRQLELFVPAEVHRPTTLDEARVVAQDCVRCDLAATRRRVVFGAGPSTAPLMVVGEGPSESDESTGLPFSGPSGRILDEWLAGLGLSRADVWLTNVVRCRSAILEGRRLRNRPPRNSEIDACRFWMECEIALVQPAVLLGLGATAGKALHGPGFTMKQHRGQWLAGPKRLPLLVTYNPAYILRLEGPQQAEAEETVRTDLAAVRAKLAR